MKTKHIYSLILTVCVFLATNGFSAQKEVGTIRLLYVENSLADTTGDLEGPVIEALQEKVEGFKESNNTKNLLYISNYGTPFYESTDYIKAYDLVAKLFDEPTKPVANIRGDLNNLRRLLDIANTKVTDKIELHYFITTHQMDKMQKNGSFQTLTSLFAKELALSTGYKGKEVEIIIYITNKNKALIKDLESKFNFFNHFGYKPATKFQLKVLKA